MSKLRVVRAELTTSSVAKLRVVSAELQTTVTAKSKLRVVRAELTTQPAPHLRVIRAELATDIAFAANAGADQHVQSLDRVYLSAAASTGDPPPNGWEWSQTAGPPVTFYPNAYVEQVSIIAPATVEGTTVSVVVTVSNGVDDDVQSDPVNIDVDPHIHWYGKAGQTLPALHVVSGP